MKSLRIVDLPNLHQALNDVLVHYHVINEDNCRLVVGMDGSRVFYDKENPRTELLITRTEPTFPPSNDKKQTKHKKGDIKK